MPPPAEGESFVRWEHRKPGDEWCLAWSMRASAHELFLDGRIDAQARDVRLPDGSSPKPGDPPRCGTCGVRTIAAADFRFRQES